MDSFVSPVNSAPSSLGITSQRLDWKRLVCGLEATVAVWIGLEATVAVCKWLEQSTEPGSLTMQQEWLEIDT
ncbi:hypothetical protein XELAEV_18013142mg [Xenopus laevis]|uniref:Uncharacterized protein n=1 Tax=Xenopus laevis TaxID=8355 RepID=A0A974DP04_XENLA|nr:hypothetical protein XELAEV_18013142mg [Xenopus laevis]